MSPSLMARIHGLDGAAQAGMEGRPPTTMYDRLGGERVIEGLVKSFYSKVLEDRVNSGFVEPFKRVSLDHHVEKQVDFLVSATGGDPTRYPGGAKKIMLMHKMFAKSAMNKAGANLWLRYMVDAIEENNEMPLEMKEPLLEFMNVEMEKYGEQFDFSFTRAKL